MSCKRPGAQLFYVNFEQLNETHWRHARHAYASEKRARHVIQGLLHFPGGEGVHEFTTSTHGCWGMQQKGKAGSSQPRLLPFFKASIRKKKHSKITSHQNIFPHPSPAQVGTEPKAPCPLPMLPSMPLSCSRHLLPVSPSPRVQKVEREIKTQVNTHYPFTAAIHRDASGDISGSASVTDHSDSRPQLLPITQKGWVEGEAIPAQLLIRPETPPTCHSKSMRSRQLM